MPKLSTPQALLKAKSLAKNGKHDQAKALYEAILETYPENKSARKGLAKLNVSHTSEKKAASPVVIKRLIDLHNEGEIASASRMASEAIKQFPDDPMLWNILGITAHKLRDYDSAIKAFGKATSLNPNFADGYNNLGAALKELGDSKAALEAYNHAVKIRPDFSQALYNLGKAYQEQGDLEDAIAFYAKALNANPDYVDVLCNLGVCFTALKRHEEALGLYNRAHAIDPGHVNTLNNMGNVLKERGMFDDAALAYRKALKIDPQFCEALSNMGTILKNQGSQDEAADYFLKALAVNPRFGEAYKNLSTVKSFSREDPQVDAVRKLVSDDSLSDADRCYLHFAYAKMLEDLGNLEEAYSNYVSGGALRAKLLDYSWEQDEESFGRAKATAINLRESPLAQSDQEQRVTPIFVLGMPRSGTTLIEQILSCHSEVHGAGELELVEEFGSALTFGKEEALPENLVAFRENYLGALSKVSQDKKYVTDKMPVNFLHLGLILNSLPEARVIHVQRNPAATCWSNFKTYFSANGLGYSYNIDTTVQYYKLYEGLMYFWRQEFGDSIYELDYDELTNDQEPHIRNLISYLGLQWEDACLHPEKNPRQVTTASQQQVRHGIYRGSSNAWLKFRPFLGGALDKLSIS